MLWFGENPSLYPLAPQTAIHANHRLYEAQTQETGTPHDQHRAYHVVIATRLLVPDARFGSERYDTFHYGHI